MAIIVQKYVYTDSYWFFTCIAILDQTKGERYMALKSSLAIKLLGVVEFDKRI